MYSRTFRALLIALLAVSSAAAKTVVITLLVTTDLHGNLLPYDFYTARPAPRGLFKIATLVEQIRKENPNTILLDLGDTIQGTPLETVYQQYVKTGRFPLGITPPAALRADPMMIAMSTMRYDAMVLGNHEFNFGLKNLDKARADAKFPILSANTRVAPGAGKPFPPYLVKDVDGVKVAIVGITTTGIPMWEEPYHIKGYSFLPEVDSAIAAVDEVRRKTKPNLVIVGAHAGLGRDLATGAPEPGELKGENQMYDVATAVPDLDALVFGHTHAQVENAKIGTVLVMQPKNWGISLGRMDFTLDDAGGAWRVVNKTSRLIPVTASTPEDPRLIRMADPYFKTAEAYLSTPVAKSSASLSSQFARVHDTAIIDAIHKVQLEYAKADVSFTSAFNTRVRIAPGPVTVREIAALYLYENMLLAIAGNGRMVREALENSAKYFLSCEGDCSQANLVNAKTPGFNYDMAQGVDYEVDLSKPAGQRIVNLRYKGKALADDQPLRIAVNNYRAGGSGGYTMFRDAKVLWRSTQEIRDLMAEYYTKSKALPAAPDNNWRILPPAAEKALERTAAAETNRMQ